MAVINHRCGVYRIMIELYSSCDLEDCTDIVQDWLNDELFDRKGNLEVYIVRVDDKDSKILGILLKADIEDFDNILRLFESKKRNLRPISSKNPIRFYNVKNIEVKHDKNCID